VVGETTLNVPKLNPTLTLKDPTGRVIDQVFQYVPMTDVPFYNCDVYYDDHYDNSASQKELSLEEARKWWNTLVKKGYNRV